MVQHAHSVAGAGGAGGDSAGGDGAQKGVVLHHGHQHGEGCRRVAGRWRHMLHDCIQQGRHRGPLGLATLLRKACRCPALQMALPHTLLYKMGQPLASQFINDLRDAHYRQGRNCDSWVMLYLARRCIEHLEV